MIRRLVAISILCLIIAAALSVAISGIDKRNRDELYKQVGLFSDALAIIQTEYVDETRPRELIYGALKGMASSLDPHSQFLDPDSYNELKIDTEGRFGGIGIEITTKDGILTVITPIEDTPAWKAGLKPGDGIVKINDELTRDMPLTEAVKRLRGRPGETVGITVLRDSEKKLLEFKIVRAIIRIKDIKEARILDDRIGYIRLAEFRETTPKDFDLALERLKKEGMTALILDLRNNPGGLLDVAVNITEKFIDDGKLIISTRGRTPSSNAEFFSHSKKPIPDLPMVILINEGSASGSEIVAAALKDYNRAIILGTKSFGKGSVQTLIPLSGGSALRLTTARYFTPSGKQINNKGIEPDIVVEDVSAQAEESDGGAKEKPPRKFDYKSDTQIMRAIDVLKAVRLYQKDPGRNNPS
ncbi:MAG: S41 family peptidase [Candidatus Omnitrophota bacterium]